MSGPLRYQNPELQDLLASNYVAGTLRGKARARMEALMRENATLARRVRQWEAKLQPLHQSTTPVPPKKSTWKAITQAMGSSKRMRPRYMVKSQLKIFAPVGIEITMVAMPKKELTLAPDPMVKK